MANMPKRVKHRKVHRGKLRGFSRRGNKVSFGEFGLQALEAGWISANVIEAARVTANRFMGGEGKLYIRLFPDKPVTSTPLETRMGKGKGEPEYWAAVIRPGTVLYEIAGVPEAVARGAFARIAHKLPLKVRCIARRTM